MTTHVAIVGAYGSAGVAVAEQLVAADTDEPLELTLIDDGDPGGGLCILRGCMPSKEVLSAGAHRFQARHDDRLTGPVPDVDLERVVARKDAHTADWAAHRRAGVEQLADHDRVELLRETARLTGRRRLTVGDRTLEPDYLVLATGSRPNVPDLPGLDAIDYYTSADVLDATELPDSGVVMGFGYAGIELSAYLAEAGVDLTVIEHDARPLDEADPPMGDALLEVYREEFDLDIRTEVYEQRIETTDEGAGAGDGDGEAVRVHLDDGTTATGEGLFLFTGRRPALPDGVTEYYDVGPEWVDDTMRAVDADGASATAGATFVVGDANGKEPILHVAKEHGVLAAENVRRHRAGRSLREYENVTHRVMFAGLGVYPFARVGHTAASARTAGHDPIVVDRAAADDGVFLTKDVPGGRARLVVGRDGTVLGYQGLHYHADAMAKTMQVIVETEMDVRSIPDRAYHPTTPEILDGLFRAATRKLDRDGRDTESDSTTSGTEAE